MDPNLTHILQGGAVVGIVAGLKQAGLPTKFAPLASLVVGAVIVAVYTLLPQYDALFNALATGLTATGAYELVGAAKADPVTLAPAETAVLTVPPSGGQTSAPTATGGA